MANNLQSSNPLSVSTPTNGGAISDGVTPTPVSSTDTGDGLNGISLEQDNGPAVALPNQPTITGVPAAAVNPLVTPPPSGLTPENGGNNYKVPHHHRWLRVTAITVLVLAVTGGAAAAIWRTQNLRNNQGSFNNNLSGGNYSTVQIPLADFNKGAGSLLQTAEQVVINGRLTVNDSLVLAPINEPTTSVAGQIYYSTVDGKVKYYDGSGYQTVLNSQDGATLSGLVNQALGAASQATSSTSDLTGNLSQALNDINTIKTQLANIPVDPTQIVTSLQGQTGAVTLVAGPGVLISGTTISSSGVLSLGGATGNLAVGNGLSLSGNQLNNSGVVSLIAGTSNLTITTDGFGNYTINSLNPDGLSLPAHTVVVGQGDGQPLGSVSAASNGLCLVSTSSGPAFMTCPGGNANAVGGSAGTIAKFSDNTTLTGSIISDDGSKITIQGGLKVTDFGAGIVQSGADGTLSSAAIDRNGNLLTGTLSVANGGTGLSIPIGATQLLGGTGSGYTAVDLLGGSGIHIDNTTGVITISVLNSACTAEDGCGYQPLPGSGDYIQNGTEPQTAANFNISGGGTATVFNATSSLRLNGNDINVSGTLSNVAYLSQNNVFTGSITISGAGALTTGSGAVTFGSLSTGIVQSNSSGGLSSGAVDRNSSTLFSNALNVANGGTGQTLLTANAVLFGNGNGAVGMASGTPGQLLVADSNNVPTFTTITGDIAISASGVTTINNGVVTNNKLQFNSFTVNPGNNLVGGGTATLGGAITLNVVDSPSFAGPVNSNLGYQLNGNTVINGSGRLQNVTADASVITTGTISIARGGTGLSTPIGANQLLGSNGSGYVATDLLAGDGISIDKVNGSMTFSVVGATCDENGCSYDPGSGSNDYIQNSLSLQAGANFNIAGGGTASVLNATTALELNGANINTAGTLTNVAYLNQNNNFTGNLTVGGTVTFSNLGAGVVRADGSGVLSSGVLDRNSSTLLAGVLNVSNGGTGLSTVPVNAILYGNGTDALATASGTTGQILLVDDSGAPVFATLTGDVTVSSNGTVTIGNGVVTNSKLANSSITINTEDGLTGGATVALGGNITLGLDSTVCTTTAGNCADNGTSGAYIQNSLTVQSDANFNIDGTGTAATFNATSALQLNGANINTAGTLTNVAYLNQANTFTGNLAVSGGSLTTDGTVTFSGLGAGVVQADGGGVLSSGTIDRNNDSLLTGTLDVAYGGTGLSSLTANGLLYGNSGGTISFANGSTGQILMADVSGVPTFVTPSGDVTINGAGVTTIGDGVVTNTKLANNNVTINTSAGLTGGGTLVLGDSLTLGLDSTVCTTSGNCDTGSSDYYIHNGLSLQADANFNIDGTGTADTLNAVTAIELNGANINTAGTLTNVAYLNQANTFTGNLTVNGTVTFTGLTNGLVQSNGGTLSSGVVDRNSASLLTGTLDVTYGGTGRSTLAANSLLYGNGTGQVSLASGTSGQLLMISGAGVPTFVTPSGDVTISASGTTTIGNGVVTNGKLANNSVTINTSTGLTGGATVALGGSLTLGIDSTVCTTAGNCDTGDSSFYIQNSTDLQADANFNIDGTGTADTLNAVTAIELNGANINTAGTLTNVAYLNQANTFTGNLAVSGGNLSTNGTVTFSGLGAGIVQTDSAGILSSGTVDRNGSLLTGTLNVAYGGTGRSSLTANSLLYGNGTSAVGLAAGTVGQLLLISGTGTPTFVTPSGDVTIDATGATTIGAGVVTNDKLANNSVTINTTSPGLTGGGTIALGGAMTIALDSTVCTTTLGNCSDTGGSNFYIQNSLDLQSDANFNIDGSGTADTFNATSEYDLNGTPIITSTGVLQNVTANAGIITSGIFGIARGGTGISSIGSAGSIAYSNGSNYAFTTVGTAGECLASGGTGIPTWIDCSAAGGGGTPGGTAGGDLSGTYPNPQVAKIQGTALNIAGPTNGQILVWNGTGWTNVSVSGDIAIDNTGVTTIQPGSVDLSTDTAGNYVTSVAVGTDLTLGGTSGHGAVPVINLGANVARLNASQSFSATQTFSASGTSLAVTNNLVLGGDVTVSRTAANTLSLATGDSLNLISGNLEQAGTTVLTSTGVLQNVTTDASIITTGTLATTRGGTGSGTIGAAGTVAYSDGSSYAFSAAGTSGYCLVSGGTGAPTWEDCSAASGGVGIGSAAGGDLSGTYPNPEVAKIQGTALNISTPTGGQILVWDGTNGWTNTTLSGDVAINSVGAATIQPNSVALGTDTTGNYVVGLTNGTGITISGTAGEGWSPTVSLSNTTVTAGGYGSASSVATFTVDAQGRLTVAGSQSINIDATQVGSGTLSVVRGGTGLGTLPTNGILFGNGTSAAGVTAAGTAGQFLQAGTSGVPGFVTISGDATIANGGVLTIANGAVTNAKLASSSITINVGTGMTGGGDVSLGSAVAIGLDGTVCTTTLGNCADSGDSSYYIQNGTSLQPSSNFYISGTGKASYFTATTALQSNELDAISGALVIGASNTTSISMYQSVVLLSGKTLTLYGSTTANRPASPSEGTLYYDTSTHQLLQYNGTKWVSSPRSATKIVAASNSSQAMKDAADYVATGSGDQSTINSALTAATGGTVYLAEGTYTISGSILIPNDTTLTGAGNGTLITIPNSLNTSFGAIYNYSSYAAGIKISNLRLDGNRSNQSSGTMRGIYLFSICTRVNTITNVQSDNWNNSGFLLGANCTSGPSYIATNNIANGNVYGFYIGSIVVSSTITGNIANNNDYGFYIYDQSVNNTITGNTARNSAVYGFYLANSNYNTVSGNTIVDSGGSTGNNAIYIASGNKNVITNNSINDTSATSTNYAININNSSATNNYLSNNVFSSTPGTSTINDIGTGTVYANQPTAENGGSLVNRTANSTTAFQIQNATGTAVLTADTSGSNINVNANLQIAGTVVITSARVLQNVTANTSILTAGTLPIARGGTNATTIGSAGSVAYSNGSSYAFSAVGTSGYCLISGGTGAPTWVSCGSQATSSGAANTALSNLASTNINAALNTTSGNLTLQTTTSGNINISPVGTINLNSNVVVAAGYSLTLTGGSTRPSSPTAGMLWYDTTTNQLLQYNGSKWVSSPRTATKIVAASNSSQAMKDAADYVATGSGDQSTINSALTAATGGTVYLAEGTYTINATISIPDNTTLAGAGAGTIITIPNSLNASSFNAIVNTNTTTGTGVTIKDLNLDGNKANQTTGSMTGISLTGIGSTGKGAILNNVQANNWYSMPGVAITSTSNSAITNSTANNNGDAGFSVSGGTNDILSGNVANNNAFYGFRLGGSYHTLTGNTMTGNATAIYINASNNTITNNTLYNTSIHGITVYSGNGNMIANNNIQNTGGSTANNAIYLSSSSSSNTITGNSITDTSATSTNYAINILNSSDANNYLSNNVFTSTPGTSVINDLGTGTVYANQPTAENGGNLVVRTANSTTAFQVQNASGVSLFTVDTSGTNVNVNANLQIAGTTVVTSGRVLQNVTADTGILTSGTLGIARGGTGTGTLGVAGAVAYSDGSGYNFTGVGTSGYCLVSGGSGAPTWTDCATAAGVGGSYINNGLTVQTSANFNIDGTGKAATLNATTALQTSGVTRITSTGVLQNVSIDAGLINTGTLGTARGGTGVDGSGATNGQLLIGNGSGGFSLATLTQGAGMIITNSAGGITLAVNGASLSGDFVQLQAGSPGTTQTGNINISGAGQGTVIANLFSGSGSSLTNLNATNVTSGVLADARLSANVALRNNANTFTADNLFKNTTDSTTAFRIQNSDASATLLTADTTTNKLTVTNTVVAAGASLTITGGNTASRPSSPTAGMLYYDTTTNQLLQYNSTKWVSAPRTATKIVAASNSSQAMKDAADYIATGSGDQSVINSALTAAAGGKVYLAEGTYTINASISIPNNTTLAGAGMGTIITIPSALNITFNAIVNSDTSTGTGVTIQDLKLDGKGSNQSSGTMNGVYLNGMGSGTGSSAVQGAKITNVRSTNWRNGAQFYLNSSSNNTLANNTGTGYGSADTGFYLSTSSNNNTLTGNIAQYDYTGFQVYSSSSNTLTGNTAQGNQAKGFSLNASNNNTLTGNTAQGNQYGFEVYISNNNTLTGNTAQGNSSRGFSIIGSSPDISSYNTLTGNTVQNSAGYGIYVSGSNNTISSNNIADSGGTTDNNAIVTDYGASLANRTRITNNTITDSSATSTNYAIVNGGSNTYLSNNVFTSTPGTSTISDTGGSSTVYAGQSTAEGGANLLQRTANSTTAFQFQNASGTSALTIDTTNMKVTVSNLSVTGSISLPHGTDYSTTGTSNNVNFGTGSVFRLTGTATQTITGIAGGTDGRQITLINAASQAATLANNSGSSSAGNKIITGTGSDLSIAAGASVSLIYDSVSTVWRVVGTISGSTSGGSYVSLQTGTVTPDTGSLSVSANGSFGGNVTVTGNTLVGGNLDVQSTVTGTSMFSVSNTYDTITLGASNSWAARTSAGQHEWQDLAISADGSKIVAVSVEDPTGVIYYSTDGGNTWAAGSGLPAEAYWGGVAMSSDGTRIVAVDFDEAMYGSTNYGATWTALGGNGTAWWDDVASSANGAKLVAGPDGGYIYTSTDYGSSWTPRTGPGQHSWGNVASSSDGSTLIIVAGDTGYIYTSANSGSSWTQRTAAGQLDWDGVAISGDGTKMLAAAGTGSDGYLHMSTNSGVAWSQVTSAGQRNWANVSMSTDGTKLVASDYGGYVYQSTDGGTTWTALTGAGQRNWGAVIISGDGTKIILADSNGYIYVQDSTTTVNVLGSLNVSKNASIVGTFTASGQALFKNTTDSTTAFQIQNAAGANLFSVNSSTGVITLGNGANTLVFNPASGLTASGTAQHAKSIVLNAEYAGAVLDALDDSTCSAAYNGTMTSGYDATNRMNYYNWASAQTTNQCYDVVAQVTLPSDWSSWAADPINIQTKTSSTSDSAVSFKVLTAGGSADTNYNYGTFSVGTSWGDSASSTLAGTYAAGDTITIKIRMTSKNSANLQVGKITLNYNSKF